MRTTAKEIKVRRALAKDGQSLKKSKAPKGANNCGGYRLVEDKTGAIIAGANFDLTLDDVASMIAIAEFVELYNKTHL